MQSPVILFHRHKLAHLYFSLDLRQRTEGEGERETETQGRRERNINIRATRGGFSRYQPAILSALPEEPGPRPATDARHPSFPASKRPPAADSNRSPARTRPPPSPAPGDSETGLPAPLSAACSPTGAEESGLRSRLLIGLSQGFCQKRDFGLARRTGRCDRPERNLLIGRTLQHARNKLVYWTHAARRRGGEGGP